MRVLSAQDEAIAEANRSLIDRDASIAALQDKGRAAEARIAALVLQVSPDHFKLLCLYAHPHAGDDPEPHPGTGFYSHQ